MVNEQPVWKQTYERTIVMETSLERKQYVIVRWGDRVRQTGLKSGLTFLGLSGACRT